MALNNTIDQASKAVFRAFKGVQVPVEFIARNHGEYDIDTGSASEETATVQMTGIVLGYRTAHEFPLELALVFERRLVDKAMADAHGMIEPMYEDQDRETTGPALFDHAKFWPDSKVRDGDPPEWQLHGVEYGFGVVKMMFHRVEYEGSVDL